MDCKVFTSCMTSINVFFFKMWFFFQRRMKYASKRIAYSTCQIQMSMNLKCEMHVWTCPNLWFNYSLFKTKQMILDVSKDNALSNALSRNECEWICSKNNPKYLSHIHWPHIPNVNNKMGAHPLKTNPSIFESKLSWTYLHIYYKRRIPLYD